MTISVSIIPEDEDLADSYFEFTRYIGEAPTNVSGVVSIGVNDEDTLKVLDNPASLTEGSVLSVHDDAGANYQNNSGFDAIAVLTLEAQGSGTTATRHVKIYSHSVADTAAGTLLFETGQQATGFFDTNNDLLTTPPMKVQNGHFLNVENVDDSRAGTNDLNISGLTTGSLLRCAVVERGA